MYTHVYMHVGLDQSSNLKKQKRYTLKMVSAEKSDCSIVNRATIEEDS